jgi:hypothetical protein
MILLDIPGIGNEGSWQVKALGTVNEAGEVRSAVLKALGDWQKSQREDFKRLFNSLQYVAEQRIHHDPSKVKEDRRKRGVYEIRANRCKLRLMFFYDRKAGALVVCTHPFSKGKGFHDKDQDAAFAKCAQIKELYEESK